MSELERGVREALSEFDDCMESLRGCGDNGCYIRHRTSRRGGMGTNGGCRCWKDHTTAQRFMVTTVRLLRDIEAALEAKR